MIATGQTRRRSSFFIWLMVALCLLLALGVFLLVLGLIGFAPPIAGELII